MKITIKTFTLTNRKTYEIDQEQQTFKISNKHFNTDVEYATLFIDMISTTWPNLLEDNTIQDGLIVKIIITDKDKKRTHTFRNKFPNNFSSLLDFLDGVENNVSRTL